MTDPTAAFIKMVPGFDFLTGLVKNAGAAMPNVGQWVAPTLDPQELEKRISELRTVQFWLEQNARLLGTTIQALEVQRMTLATLKSMNVSFADLTESLKVKVPEPAPAPAPTPQASKPAASAEGAAAKPGVVDPMQWWGALTQQFTELASNAMKEGNTDAARKLAGAMVQQGVDAAGQALKKAASMPMAAAQRAASAAQDPAGAKPAVPQRAAATSARPAAAKPAAKTRSRQTG